MALSTEETVRAELVKTLRSIAQAELGFEAIDGNIHDYLLEFEQPEKHRDYLVTRADDKTALRAWGAEVFAGDAFIGTGLLTERTYNITLESYYDIGVEGSGIKLLGLHQRKVIGALREKGTGLADTLDISEGISVSRPQVVPTGVERFPYMIVSQLTYQGRKRGPAY